MNHRIIKIALTVAVSFAAGIALYHFKSSHSRYDSSDAKAFFMNRLTEISGPNAKSCDLVGSMREVPRCIEAALAQRSTYWFTTTLQGIEGRTQIGVASDSDGLVWAIGYEEFQGRAAHLPKLLARQCQPPVVVKDRFSCNGLIYP